jgi:hypothetical protein
MVVIRATLDIFYRALVATFGRHIMIVIRDS